MPAVTNLKGLVTSSWPSSSDMMNEIRVWRRDECCAGDNGERIQGGALGKGLGWEISLCVECWQLSESDVPKVKMCASGPPPGQWARLLGWAESGPIADVGITP